MDRCALILAALVLFSRPVAGLDVHVPDGLLPAWERLVARFPLPASDTPGTIRLQGGAAEGDRIVEYSILAAVAPMWEKPVDLTAAAARSSRLEPVEEVRLPDVALSVEGLYPGDPGYALETVISVRIDGADPALQGWFASLPSLRRIPRIRWIGAVGDIMPARGSAEVLRADDGEKRVFGDTLPSLTRLDLLLGNLEAAATTGGIAARKTYTFRFDPRALAGLARAGFSYLSLANNHTFDFGVGGFVSTLDSLRRAGIATAGAGRDVMEAAIPARLQAGETAVRVLSFGAYPVDRAGFDGRVTARAGVGKPGTLWLDGDGLAAAARAFARDSFNIAMVHGGEEWNAVPTRDQVGTYRALLAAGADLVIGSHPHVLQPLEARDGKMIAYSLGNFLFPGMDGTPGGESSIIFEAGISQGRIVALRLVPVRLRGGTVRTDPSGTPVDTILSLSRAHALSHPENGT